MINPYIPFATKLNRVIVETDDMNIKTFVSGFCCSEDEARFRYLPGQFAMLSVLGIGEAAFGLASSPTESGVLEFTVNKIGAVTTALHNLEIGDTVWIRGPLGTHYPVEELKGKPVVIIGGGYAFTTLRSLVYYMLDAKNRDQYGEITVVYGARNPGLLLYREELAELSGRRDLKFIATVDKADEGWQGHVGVVPKVMEELAPDARGAYAIICGPPMMIKYTLPVVERLGFQPENVILSLERKMKCGVGMCGRCNIGSKYVCKDGPVFTLRDLQTTGELY